MTDLEEKAKIQKKELNQQKKAIADALTKKGYKSATKTGSRNVLSSDRKLRIGSTASYEGDFLIQVKNPKLNSLGTYLNDGELKIYLPDNSKLKDKHLVTLPNGNKTYQSYDEKTSPVIKEVLQSLNLEVKDHGIISSSRGAGSTKTSGS